MVQTERGTGHDGGLEPRGENQQILVTLKPMRDTSNILLEDAQPLLEQ